MTPGPAPTELTVALPAGGYAPDQALAAVRQADLPATLGQLARGPFGLTSQGVALLETLAAATDVGLAAAAGLQGLILEQAGAVAFQLPALTPEQRQLSGAFQIVTMADAAQRRLAELVGTPAVTGALELEGLPDLLAGGGDPAALARRVLALAASYARLKTRPPEDKATPDTAAGATVAAFLELLRRAVIAFSGTGALRPLVASLGRCAVRVVGHEYDGLEVRAATEAPAGLLPIQPTQIVGNDDYLEAGLKLARDVAGFDFAQGNNPKRVNPVLFGLGRPGCGKTVTAHAVGNYFLAYCRERRVPARFVVVRRTDWASSYQNASALNLVRIFREEVYGFDGVCGVYWPDIDTAFASRSATDLRMEEKQNLGAVFGVFDGTLLPRDGKWFLICDANTLHMDEATISRIAQNPFSVAGPTTADQYVRLMRELMLADLTAFVPAGDDAWARLGALAVANDLSGRAIDAVCGNIRARVQDFEYPDAYFAADSAERARIVESLCQPVDEAAIREELDAWVAFQRTAEERAAEERFDRAVEQLVEQLNAGRAAAAQAVEAQLTPPAE